MNKERILELAEESGMEIYGLVKGRDKWEESLIKFTQSVIRDFREENSEELKELRKRHFNEFNNYGITYIPYETGLYNGLEIALSIFENRMCRVILPFNRPIQQKDDNLLGK